MAEIAGFTADATGVIDDEVVQLVSVDWMTGNVKRGGVGSVPVPPAAGARIWFYADSSAVDPVKYAAGVTISAKVLPYSPGGWLDAALAPVDTLLMVQRQYRPYPPGKLQIGGVAYPAAVEGDVVLIWTQRDRALQADQVIDTTQTNIGPEAGTIYRHNSDPSNRLSWRSDR